VVVAVAVWPIFEPSDDFFLSFLISCFFFL